MQQMYYITDYVLRIAVADIADSRFDSHDLYRAIMRVAPRAYARELYRCVDDDDPINRLHREVAQRLAMPELSGLCRQRHEKRTSLNIRGQRTLCEVWDKVCTAVPLGNDPLNTGPAVYNPETS